MNLEPNTILIVTGVLVGIAIIFGIYKLATAHLNERHSLKPSSETAPKQTFRTFLIILISILLLAGLFFAYSAFIAP